jgi:hypothetical protein
MQLTPTVEEHPVFNITRNQLLKAVLEEVDIETVTDTELKARWELMRLMWRTVGL